jgi:hypothetical protein
MRNVRSCRHRSSSLFLADETARSLRRIAADEGAEARLAGDEERMWGDEPYTIEMLISRIMELVNEVPGRHDGLATERYNDDGAFRGRCTK